MAKHPTEPGIQKFSAAASKEIAMCSIKSSPTKTIKERAIDILHESESLESLHRAKVVRASPHRSAQSRPKQNNGSGSVRKRKAAPTYVTSPKSSNGYDVVSFSKYASPIGRAPQLPYNLQNYSASTAHSELLNPDDDQGRQSGLVIFDGDHSLTRSDKEERLFDAYGIPAASRPRQQGGIKRTQLQTHIISAESSRAWGTPPSGQELIRNDMLGGPRPAINPESSRMFDYSGETSRSIAGRPVDSSDKAKKRKKQSSSGLASRSSNFSIQIEHAAQLRVTRVTQSPFASPVATQKSKAKPRRGKAAGSAREPSPAKQTHRGDAYTSVDSMNAYATQLFQDEVSNPSRNRQSVHDDSNDRERMSFADKLHKMIDKAKSTLANTNVTSMAAEDLSSASTSRSQRPAEPTPKTRPPVATAPPAKKSQRAPEVAASKRDEPAHARPDPIPTPAKSSTTSSGSKTAKPVSQAARHDPTPHRKEPEHAQQKPKTVKPTATHVSTPKAASSSTKPKPPIANPEPEEPRQPEVTPAQDDQHDGHDDFLSLESGADESIPITDDEAQPTAQVLEAEPQTNEQPELVVEENVKVSDDVSHMEYEVPCDQVNESVHVDEEPAHIGEVTPVSAEDEVLAIAEVERIVPAGDEAHSSARDLSEPDVTMPTAVDMYADDGFGDDRDADAQDEEMDVDPESQRVVSGATIEPAADLYDDEGFGDDEGDKSEPPTAREEATISTPDPPKSFEPEEVVPPNADNSEPDPVIIVSVDEQDTVGLSAAHDAELREANEDEPTKLPAEPEHSDDYSPRIVSDDTAGHAADGVSTELDNEPTVDGATDDASANETQYHETAKVDEPQTAARDDLADPYAEDEFGDDDSAAPSFRSRPNSARDADVSSPDLSFEKTDGKPLGEQTGESETKSNAKENEPAPDVMDAADVSPPGEVVNVDIEEASPTEHSQVELANDGVAVEAPKVIASEDDSVAAIEPTTDPIELIPTTADEGESDTFANVHQIDATEPSTAPEEDTISIPAFTETVSAVEKSESVSQEDAAPAAIIADAGVTEASPEMDNASEHNIDVGNVSNVVDTGKLGEDKAQDEVDVTQQNVEVGGDDDVPAAALKTDIDNSPEVAIIDDATPVAAGEDGNDSTGVAETQSGDLTQRTESSEFANDSYADDEFGDDDGANKSAPTSARSETAKVTPRLETTEGDVPAVNTDMDQESGNGDIVTATDADAEQPTEVAQAPDSSRESVDAKPSDVEPVSKPEESATTADDPYGEDEFGEEGSGDQSAPATARDEDTNSPPVQADRTEGEEVAESTNKDKRNDDEGESHTLPDEDNPTTPAADQPGEYIPAKNAVEEEEPDTSKDIKEPPTTSDSAVNETYIDSPNLESADETQREEAGEDQYTDDAFGDEDGGDKSVPPSAHATDDAVPAPENSEPGSDMSLKPDELEENTHVQPSVAPEKTTGEELAAEDFNTASTPETLPVETSDASDGINAASGGHSDEEPQNIDHEVDAAPVAMESVAVSAPPSESTNEVEAVPSTDEARPSDETPIAVDEDQMVPSILAESTANSIVGESEDRGHVEESNIVPDSQPERQVEADESAEDVYADDDFGDEAVGGKSQPGSARNLDLYEEDNSSGLPETNMNVESMESARVLEAPENTEVDKAIRDEPMVDIVSCDADLAAGTTEPGRAEDAVSSGSTGDAHPTEASNEVGGDEPSEPADAPHVDKAIIGEGGVEPSANSPPVSARGEHTDSADQSNGDVTTTKSDSPTASEGEIESGSHGIASARDPEDVTPSVLENSTPADVDDTRADESIANDQDGAQQVKRDDGTENTDDLYADDAFGEAESVPDKSAPSSARDKGDLAEQIDSGRSEIHSDDAISNAVESSPPTEDVLADEVTEAGADAYADDDFGDEDAAKSQPGSARVADVKPTTEPPVLTESDVSPNSTAKIDEPDANPDSPANTDELLIETTQAAGDAQLPLSIETESSNEKRPVNSEPARTTESAAHDDGVSSISDTMDASQPDDSTQPASDDYTDDAFGDDDVPNNSQPSTARGGDTSTGDSLVDVTETTSNTLPVEKLGAAGDVEPAIDLPARPDQTPSDAIEPTDIGSPELPSEYDGDKDAPAVTQEPGSIDPPEQRAADDSVGPVSDPYTEDEAGDSKSSTNLTETDEHSTAHKTDQSAAEPSDPQIDNTTDRSSDDSPLQLQADKTHAVDATEVDIPHDEGETEETTKIPESQIENGDDAGAEAHGVDQNIESSLKPTSIEPSPRLPVEDTYEDDTDAIEHNEPAVHGLAESSLTVEATTESLATGKPTTTQEADAKVEGESAVEDEYAQDETEDDPVVADRAPESEAAVSSANKIDVEPDDAYDEYENEDNGEDEYQPERVTPKEQHIATESDAVKAANVAPPAAEADEVEGEGEDGDYSDFDDDNTTPRTRSKMSDSTPPSVPSSNDATPRDEATNSASSTPRAPPASSPSTLKQDSEDENEYANDEDDYDAENDFDEEVKKEPPVETATKTSTIVAAAENDEENEYDAEYDDFDE